MRKGTKLIIVLILFLSAVNSKAQSTAIAVATVTIVEPATVSSNQSQEFEKVEGPSVFDRLFKNGNVYLPGELVKIPAYNSRIIAADFTINTSAVYGLTIPQKIFLSNASGTEKMEADLSPDSALGGGAPQNGKNHLVIGAGLQIRNGQTPGRYASQAFDVTVNFN